MSYAYTPKQLQVMDFIREFVEQHRYSPTLDEAAGHFGISKISVLQHMRALEKRGAIHRPRYTTRGIEIRDPDFRPTGYANSEGSGRRSGSGARHRPAGAIPLRGFSRLQIPHKGYIAAGRPIEAIEQDESIDLASLMTRGHDCFVLQVRGDSMIDDHIRDGDYVVIESRTDPENGETVVALLDTGDATLKRFYRTKTGIRLEAANPNYPPIECPAGSVTVQGVVVGVLRTY